jgi:DNA primase
VNQIRKTPAGNKGSSKAQNRLGSTRSVYRKSGGIDVRKLKERIDTAAFYTRETGRLVSSINGWHSAICPVHDDTKPSLRVLIPAGAYKCLACGVKGGDIIDFVKEKYGKAFPDALNYLQREHGGGL